MRISDWSSDVCSSDLRSHRSRNRADRARGDGAHAPKRHACQAACRVARADRGSGPGARRCDRARGSGLMAEVTLTIGDRAHVVACRDGEEAQFRHLGTLLDERWEVASRASGNMGNERTMLFVALMLADRSE